VATKPHGTKEVTQAVEALEAEFAALAPFAERPPFTEADRIERRRLLGKVQELNSLCSVTNGVPITDGTAKALKDRIAAAWRRLEGDF
jgi:hypothetical protein